MTVRRRLAFLGLLGFAFVLPWEDAVVLPQVGSIGRLSGLLFLVLALPQFVDRGAFVMRRPALAVVTLAVFTLWSSATLLWTVDPAATTVSVMTLVQLLVMVALIWQICDTEQRRRAAMQAYVLGSIVAISSAFVNYSLGQEVAFGRFAATGFDPNDFAVILALGIPMAWQLSRSAMFLPAVVNLAYIPLALVAIVLSASRGGTIAAGVGLLAVLFGFMRMPRATRRAASAIGVTLLVTLPITAPLVQALAETSLYRLSTIASRSGDVNLNEREVIWRSGLDALPEHPIVGAGLGAFPSAIERTGAAPEVAHNSFLSVLVETGAVGMLLFATTLLVVVLPLLRAPSALAVPNLVLFATLMVAMMPLSWELRKPTWYVLGLLMTCQGAALAPRLYGIALPAIRSTATSVRAELSAVDGGRCER